MILALSDYFWWIWFDLSHKCRKIRKLQKIETRSFTVRFESGLMFSKRDGRPQLVVTREPNCDMFDHRFSRVETSKKFRLCSVFELPRLLEFRRYGRYLDGFIKRGLRTSVLVNSIVITRKLCSQLTVKVGTTRSVLEARGGKTAMSDAQRVNPDTAMPQVIYLAIIRCARLI